MTLLSRGSTASFADASPLERLELQSRKKAQNQQTQIQLPGASTVEGPEDPRSSRYSRLNLSRQSLCSMLSTDTASSGLLAKLKLDDEEWDAIYDGEEDNISLMRRDSQMPVRSESMRSSDTTCTESSLESTPPPPLPSGLPSTISIPASKFRSLRPLLNSLKQQQLRNSAAKSAIAMGNTVNDVRNQKAQLVSVESADVQSIHPMQVAQKDVSDYEEEDDVEDEISSPDTPLSGQDTLFSAATDFDTDQAAAMVPPSSIRRHYGHNMSSSDSSSSLMSPSYGSFSSTSTSSYSPPRRTSGGLNKHMHSMSNPVDTTAITHSRNQSAPESPFTKTFHHTFYHATAPSPVLGLDGSNNFESVAPSTPPPPVNPRARSLTSSNSQAVDRIRAQVVRRPTMVAAKDKGYPPDAASSSRVLPHSPLVNGFSGTNTHFSPSHVYRQLLPQRVQSPMSPRSQTPRSPAKSPLQSRQMDYIVQQSPRTPMSPFSPQMGQMGHRKKPSIPPPMTPKQQQEQQMAQSPSPRPYATPLQPAAHSSLTPESRVAMAINLRKSGQSKEAAYQLQIAANEGSVEAMFLFGLSLRYAYGVPTDERGSFLWLCKAGGIAPDKPYSFGIDPKSILRTVQQEGKVLKSHGPRSAIFFEIGQAYLNGWGCRADLKQSIEFFEVSGSLGYCDAMCEAGTLWTGKTVNTDRTDLGRAATWFRLAEACGAELIGSGWIHKKRYD